MEFIQIEVRGRDERGTAAVDRLRRDGFVPAVLYGLKQQNLSLAMPARELERFVRSGSRLVELKMGDESRDAILREVQQHPITDVVLHVDFLRVDKNASVEDQVPVTFKGMAVGTKEGGLFQGLLDHLRVSARPRDLPEGILLDVSKLHVGDGIHVSDLDALEGVTFLHEPEDLIAHVVAMRGSAEDEEEAEAGEPALIEGDEAAAKAGDAGEGGA